MATVYKPAGVPARELQWTQLALDEFEAVRLIDGQGLDQETAAAQMGVSRPTITRILASARAKIAHVLVHGQALLIEGGPIIQAPIMPFQGSPGGCRRGRGGQGPGPHGKRRGYCGGSPSG